MAPLNLTSLNKMQHGHHSYAHKDDELGENTKAVLSSFSGGIKMQGLWEWKERLQFRLRCMN